MEIRPQPQSLTNRTKLLILGSAISIATIFAGVAYEKISKDDLTDAYQFELNVKDELSKSIADLESLKNKTLHVSADYANSRDPDEHFFSYSLNRTVEKIDERTSSTRVELSNFVNGTRFKAHDRELAQITETGSEVVNHGIYGLLITAALGFLSRKKTYKSLF